MKTVRQVESLLGVQNLDSTTPDGPRGSALGNGFDATQVFLGEKRSEGILGKVLSDAAPILAKIAREYSIATIFNGEIPTTDPLVTM